MIEIDHGNGLVSRYAHASKLLVKEGDLVVRGQEIARVGTTGRSTGPHLHFEVRLNGVPQNPARFLQPVS
jgi:murein DD-endopeptidase MepM/ murein hydrolase activator NlpD